MLFCEYICGKHFFSFFPLRPDYSGLDRDFVDCDCDINTERVFYHLTALFPSLALVLQQSSPFSLTDPVALMLYGRCFYQSSVLLLLYDVTRRCHCSCIRRWQRAAWTSHFNCAFIERGSAARGRRWWALKSHVLSLWVNNVPGCTYH